MKSAEMEREEARRLGILAVRTGNRCRCGRYKWPGFSFCVGCTDRLPENLRSGLYAKEAGAYRDAYEKAAAHLAGIGIMAFDATGKIQGRPAL